MTPRFCRLLAAILTFGALVGAEAQDAPRPPEFSGIYPHLAMFNDEGECGTGAVVPWANRLWVVTYGPHFPRGSSDKLYEIDPGLNVSVRPESVGGTPASRLLHRESGQLFIGPYAIDERRTVRVIPPAKMPGRLTATMRHLTDPAGKVYFATMEEGFYEVDVRTLAVKALYPDANRPGGGDHAGPLLPGYHGKGAYTGQNRVVYANNGEYTPEAMKRPDVPSGCLAEWDGRNWRVVRRNQFCDVTGPGGIAGSARPDSDPIWSIGWDHRSLILMLLDGGAWHTFRLPKATHTYDGAHGWNTEWPRIRAVGDEADGGDDLLMTMHGTFWRFPKTFSAADTAGIRPRSTYLKVVGDFCNWGDSVVFGCDDTAKSQFLNKRKAKGGIAGPGQSQSNLWFVRPKQLDQLGPSAGRGAVWLRDDLKGGDVSDPFLFAGYRRKAVHLAHSTPTPVTFEFEVQPDGRGPWRRAHGVTVPAGGYAWADLSDLPQGEWVRVRPSGKCDRATVLFHFANPDNRGREAGTLFDGLASAGAPEFAGGIVRSRGENKRTLHLAATTVRDAGAEDVGYYELDATMKLRRVDDPAAHEWLKKNVAIPRGVLAADAASVLYVDDAGRRWRLPKGDEPFDALTTAGAYRVDREVVTERDLFNCHGTFYELPAENAGGFAKVRPVATHNRRITDYCSYRGLLVMTGIDLRRTADNRHVVRSDDGKAAVWVGAVDDLWKLGKPAGRGGPWKDAPARAGQPSDPYLMNGYVGKRLTLSHAAAGPVRMRVEVDVTGDGDWVTYQVFDVPAAGQVSHMFPAAFHAYWLRVTADADCSATAWLDYD
jgi:hypothetical protein